MCDLWLQVLSPSPRFVNPGYTAWANGYGSPMMFVMRCNPQHYYLLHEIGHRLGMPHATIFKLLSDNSSINSQPAQVTSSSRLCQSSLTAQFPA
jgi:hypothetical protein